MVWVRIDDQVPHHPKFTEAGPIASWLWLCGNAYCNKYLTDGYIKRSILHTLGAVTSPEKWADRLVEVGLWERAEDGYVVHHFLEFNPSAEEVRRKREEDRKRKRQPRGGRNGHADA